MSEWISVEDSLPPKTGQYLTHWPDGEIETYDFQNEIAELGWKRPLSRYGIVTHWMPLPAPPKEDSE